MIKVVLLIACLGHIICGITDCMLAYSRSGRFEFSDAEDNENMRKVFSTMSSKQIELAMMMGVHLQYSPAVSCYDSYQDSCKR